MAYTVRTFRFISLEHGALIRTLSGPTLSPYPDLLTMYSLVEAWAWGRREEDLVDRRRSPWDAEERRPSHADKRKALQREILQEEIQALAPQRRKRREFQHLLARLLDLAA